MTSVIDFRRKSIVIITGASQGIGQKISEFIGLKCENGSKIILIARSEPGLVETRNKIMKSNSNVIVNIYCQDLSKPNIKDYEGIFDQILQDEECSYENAIIFHNAGQVGLLINAAQLNNLEELRSYYDLNLFSTVLLNSVFIKKCKENIPYVYIINISSMCGRKPFPNMALYGSAKAARDLYFSVLSVEEPNINILTYSPGPVNTAMFNQVIKNAQSAELKTQFKDIKTNNIILSTEQTVEKLLKILESGKYKSGGVIDYFDEM